MSDEPFGVPLLLVLRNDKSLVESNFKFSFEYGELAMNGATFEAGPRIRAPIIDLIESSFDCKTHLFSVCKLEVPII